MPVRSVTAAFVACAIGCAADVDTVPLDFGTDGDPTESLAPPSFLDPADRRLVLSTAQLEDVELRVADVYAGLTVLVVDDTSLGPLQPAEPVGHLEPERLRLFFRGGMIAGAHSLELLTPGTTRLLRSEFVNVAIQAEDPVQLSAGLEPDPIAAGTMMTTAGTGDQATLVALDERTVPMRLTVLHSANGSWAPASALSLELPGYQPGFDETAPAVTAALDVEHESIRLAWRIGWPGRRIDIMVASLDGAMPASTPRTAIDVAELVDGAEYGYVDRPLLFGPTLIAQLSAFHDVERPRHDETTPVVVSLADSDGPYLPRPVQVSPGRGIDGFTPVLDLTARPGTTSGAFAARLDGGEIAVIDLHPQAGTLTLRPGESTWIPALLDLDGPLLTATSRFSARTSAFMTDTVLYVVRSDASGSNPPRLADTNGLFPVVQPSGPPAMGILRGVLLLLLPFGSGNQVQVVQPNADREALVITPLEGAFCDRVAIPMAQGDDSGSTLPWACLLDGAIRIGHMEATD